MYIAVVFSDAGGNEPGVIKGIFTTAKKAVSVLTSHFDEDPVNVEDDVYTWGYVNEGEIDQYWGQVFKLEADQEVSIDI